MIDFTTNLGKRARERLASEYCIWLTTTGTDGTPQPRPVWFVWDNGEFVIYSPEGAAKLKHIAANPKVALNFDGGTFGEDIQVFIGHARVTASDFGSAAAKAYFAKYADQIPEINMTEASFKAMFSQTIRITADKLR